MKLQSRMTEEYLVSRFDFMETLSREEIMEVADTLARETLQRHLDHGLRGSRSRIKPDLVNCGLFMKNCGRRRSGKQATDIRPDKDFSDVSGILHPVITSLFRIIRSEMDPLSQTERLLPFIPQIRDRLLAAFNSGNMS